MAEIIEKPEWKEFLRNFSTRHQGARTRLGVFEIRDGVVNDLWIEDGAPLVGIDIDTKQGKQTIGIVFEHFRHSISDVCLVNLLDVEPGGGLDIQDGEGKITALRFEDCAVEGED